MLHPDSLALSRLYHWEARAPTRVVMTQPVRDRAGKRTVVDYTWGQVADEARRMAAHLQLLGLPPGSTIALLSKNCAHWLIADLAIWLGSYVSVPLYPTLGTTTIGKILSHSGGKFLSDQELWLGQFQSGGRFLLRQEMGPPRPPRRTPAPTQSGRDFVVGLAQGGAGQRLQTAGAFTRDQPTRRRPVLRRALASTDLEPTDDTGP